MYQVAINYYVLKVDEVDDYAISVCDVVKGFFGSLDFYSLNIGMRHNLLDLLYSGWIYYILGGVVYGLSPVL